VLQRIPTGAQAMKNVYEVLRQKELELARLEKEVEALRVAAPLLSEDKEPVPEAVNSKPTLASPNPAQQPIRIPQPAAAPAAGTCGRMGRHRQTVAVDRIERRRDTKTTGASLCRKPSLAPTPDHVQDSHQVHAGSRGKRGVRSLQNPGAVFHRRVPRLAPIFQGYAMRKVSREP